MTTGVRAAEGNAPPDESGFYAGISLRQNATDAGGLALGKTPGLAWSRLAPVVADDTASRTLLFGGYRWTNDISVEAAMSSADRYALRPLGQGVGLKFGPGTTSGSTDFASRSVNVDVVTSWNVYKAFALYGRMGYAQSDTPIVYSGLNSTVLDPRRNRDGMNYGVGVRYDLNSSLGLRLEYGRFGRLTGEVGNGLPESDQVTFGLQLRF
jgi:opacity protein-like surface antigen